MAEQHEAVSDAPEAGPASRLRGIGPRLFGVLVIVMAAAAVAGIWYAYELGVRHGAATSPPLIKADPAPTKVAPESPGGLEIPHQDKRVYGALDSSVDEPEVEHLLAPPEEPLPRPDPVPVEAAAAPAEPQEPASEAAAIEPPAETTPAIEPSAETAPAATPEPVNAAPVVTVERAPEAVEPATDETPPPRGREALLAGFRIQIGSFRTAAAAARAWTRVRESSGDLLTGLDHVVVPADLGSDRGIFHRLQAGPFANREEASGLCARLKAHEQGCLVVTP